ncbi:hypothetical protein BaRGS_00002987 [Batillaria attramentaria]|uniref:XK-related protein n=1 Tax=Batillaria attramentaria TaxID=370345 RepID=A0ABD0M2I8_9CAEN
MSDTSMPDSDRQQPTDSGDAGITLEEVTPSATAEDADRQQPADSGEAEMMMVLEKVTTCATTEDVDRQQPPDSGETDIVLEVTTPPATAEDADRQQPAGSDEAVIILEEVTQSTTAEDADRQQLPDSSEAVIMLEEVTPSATAEDADRQQLPDSSETDILLEVTTPSDTAENADRQQPPHSGEAVIMLEEVTTSATAEDADTHQPPGSAETEILLEEVTPSAAAEIKSAEDTQSVSSTCLRTCGTWKPCMLAKSLWGNIYDKKKHNVDFTRLEFVLGVVSIIIYFVDMGTDVWLAVEYFQGGEWIYGGLTTAFIVAAYVPLLIIALNSYRMYDEIQSRLWWVCKLVLVILGLSPVVATLECMYYGWRGRTRPDDALMYNPFLPAFLRLLESFLEAAPQLCFQLYIIFKEKPEDDTFAAVLRSVTVLSSSVSLALSAVIYRKHNSSVDKWTIRCHVLYFLWRVCETGGRVLCIALFASMLEYWLSVVLGPHFLIMVAWAVWASHDRSITNTLLGICWGYTMLFFVPFHSNPSRYVYLLYYVIFYTENFLMLGLWAGMTSDRDAWFYIPGIVVVVVFFLLHVVMLFLYYKVAHPKASEIKYRKGWDWDSVRGSLKYFSE